MKRFDSSKIGVDGVTVMVNKDRALRAREVSQPTPAQQARAKDAVDELIKKAQGRRPSYGR